MELILTGTVPIHYCDVMVHVHDVIIFILRHFHISYGIKSTNWNQMCMSIASIAIGVASYIAIYMIVYKWMNKDAIKITSLIKISDERLQCTICSYLVVGPLQLTCGHRICTSCGRKLKQKRYVYSKCFLGSWSMMHVYHIFIQCCDVLL